MGGCYSSSAHADEASSAQQSGGKPEQLQLAVMEPSDGVSSSALIGHSASPEEKFPTDQEKDKADLPISSVNRNIAFAESSAGNVPSSVTAPAPAPPAIGIPGKATDRKDNAPPLKKGFILKEGHIVKNWKNRFFVLEAGVLMYYESSTDKPPYGVKKKGEMILAGATAKVNKNFIEISYVNKEGENREGPNQLNLDIRYPTEREEWLQAIKQHIAFANKSS